MDDSEEIVLFEQGNVKVTNLRVIIAQQGSYRLADLISAEAGHQSARVADWLWFAILGGILLAVCEGGMFLTGMPSVDEDVDPAAQVLAPLPAKLGWQFVLGGLAIAAIGAVVMMVLNLIWGRSIVRVETTSDESKILFRARDRKLVEGIVKAINQAIGSSGEPAQSKRF